MSDIYVPVYSEVEIQDVPDKLLEEAFQDVVHHAELGGHAEELREEERHGAEVLQDVVVDDSDIGLKDADLEHLEDEEHSLVGDGFVVVVGALVGDAKIQNKESIK